MREILRDIDFEQTESKVLMCDNISTIKLSVNAAFHGRTKHIRVRYHFLRDLNIEGTVQMQFCGSSDQVADIMTNPLKLGAFQKLQGGMGVCAIPDVN